MKMSRSDRQTAGRSVFFALALDVDQNGEDDDQTLDDLLPVGGDAQDIQTVGDNREQEGADDNAPGLSDTAGYGDTAHDAGSDRVHLVTLGSGRLSDRDS